MGNCLVKKLQTTVDDKNLDILNEVVIEAIGTDNGIYPIVVKSSIPQDVKLYNNSNDLISQTLNSENVCVSVNGTSTPINSKFHYKLELSNKYNITDLLAQSTNLALKFDLSIFKYNDVFKSYSHGEAISNTVTGDVANILKPSLTAIYVESIGCLW